MARGRRLPLLSRRLAEEANRAIKQPGADSSWGDSLAFPGSVFFSFLKNHALPVLLNSNALTSLENINRPSEKCCTKCSWKSKKRRLVLLNSFSLQRSWQVPQGKLIEMQVSVGLMRLGNRAKICWKSGQLKGKWEPEAKDTLDRIILRNPRNIEKPKPKRRRGRLLMAEPYSIRRKNRHRGAFRNKTICIQVLKSPDKKYEQIGMCGVRKRWGKWLFYNWSWQNFFQVFKMIPPKSHLLNYETICAYALVYNAYSWLGNLMDRRDWWAAGP